MGKHKKMLMGCKVCRVILWINCIFNIIVALVSIIFASSMGEQASNWGFVTMNACIASSILYGWLAKSVNEAVKYIEKSLKEKEQTK